MSNEDLKMIELEDKFYLHNQSSKLYLVKYSTTHLSIFSIINQNNNEIILTDHVQIIPIDDIYGCLCMRADHNLIQCFLCLYIYTLKKTKNWMKKDYLHRTHRILVYGKFDNYERNLEEVTKWHRLITKSIYLRRNLPLDIVAKRDKRVLVFINPASGAGKAQRLVLEHVVGVWSEAEFSYQIVLTEYAGHARDYVRSIQLDDWNGIVVASGDGLIFEIINGLMNRNDWQEAMKLPIGHLPGGSGNAFITNIIRYSQQPIMDTMEKFIVQAAVLVSAYQVIPFDLALIDISNGQRLFSFLCIEWGIIADVDCESEQYRFLGEARFTVEAIKRIIRPRVYNGYIDYIPYEPSDTSVNSQSITQLHQHLLPFNEPILVDTPTSKWRRIQGPFAHVLITSKASISKDVIASSKSTLSDGYLTLQFIRTDNSVRSNLVKVFTKLSDGKHFDYDFVEWMPIRAFRIVPNETSGNLMVDGEKVPYGPIQGECLPSFARCMGKHPQVPLISNEI